MEKKELSLLEALRDKFEARKSEEIPFYDIKMFLSNYNPKQKAKSLRRLSPFQCATFMKRLWRAGYVRRFKSPYSPRASGSDAERRIITTYKLWPKEYYEE